MTFIRIAGLLVITMCQCIMAQTANPKWEYNKKAKRLEVSSGGSDADFLEACTKHPDARELRLYSNNVTSFSPLAKLTELKKLKCRCGRERAYDLKYLSHLTTLVELDCNSTNVTNTDALKNLKNLKKINFLMSSIDSLDFAAHLPDLEDLNLYGQDGFKDYTPLVGLKKLKRINIYMNEAATDELLAPLEALTSLETFESVNNFKVTHLGFLRNCGNLKVVDCGPGNVKDISALKEIATLERLDLQRCPIKDISPLEGKTELRMLNLEKTKVSELGALATCTALEYLHVQNTKIMNLSPLKSCPKLQKLYVSKDMPQDQIDALKEALPKLKVEVR